MSNNDIYLCYISGNCHIHKIMLSPTPDLHSHIYQLWNTFAQIAVRTLVISTKSY